MLIKHKNLTSLAINQDYTFLLLFVCVLSLFCSIRLKSYLYVKLLIISKILFAQNEKIPFQDIKEQISKVSSNILMRLMNRQSLPDSRSTCSPIRTSRSKLSFRVIARRNGGYRFACSTT